MRCVADFAGLMALVYASATLGAAPPPPNQPDLERGKQIATTVCAACHGADGNSTVAANPVLAGQHADYTTAQLAAFKSGARPSPIMAGMVAGLSPDDMRALGAWFEGQKAKAPAPAKDKALALRGQQIWRGGVKSSGVPACAGCHGATGKGIPSQYPRLAGQFPELTLGWLKAYASGTRQNPVMAGVASKLNEADMRAVAEYISGLR